MATATNPDRLLDAWSPPADAGEPVGFIATTFTFNADFFEQDCLGAFLQMESDMDSEGLAYLIEREEKLSKIECAMVIADQRHCNSKQRNIRWDLLPFRMRNGIQHAKISLLVWTKSIRIMIGSANLTEEGYRRNQELYAVFDITEESTVPLDLARQTIAFLQGMLNEGITADSSVSGRGTRLLERVSIVLDNWQLVDMNDRRGSYQVWPVFIKPGAQSALVQLARYWQNNYRYLPDDLEVISPFFDQEYSAVHPLTLLNKLVTNKGSLFVSTTAEDKLEPNGQRRVHLPAYYEQILSNRLHINWLNQWSDEEKGREYRPLHLKAIRAFKGNWGMLMLGSSNFTSAGLGTNPNYTNYEANVVYIASSASSKEAMDGISKCLPHSTLLKEGEYQLDQQVRLDESEQTDLQPLPECILSAEADMIEGRTVIQFNLSPPKLQYDLQICLEGGEHLLSLTRGMMDSTISYEWFDPQKHGQNLRSLPAGFEVVWAEGEKRAWLPMNVKNYEVLPPPEELKSLPFHVLLRVLTSAKPLQVILRRYYRSLKVEVQDETPVDPMSDPHKRVDTSGFLLQRTRRISYAYNAIREKLSKPIGSLQSLKWRIYGPVGLQALVNAILSDKEDAELKLPEERAFFLAELILELSSIKPDTAVNYLPAETVRTELQKFIDQLKNRILQDPELKDSWIRPYVEKSISKAMEKAK